MPTGDLPLKADSEIQLMRAHIDTPPTDIRRLRLDVPKPVADLVMKCLEKERDLRPTSGRVLIETLNACEQEPSRRRVARTETGAGHSLWNPPEGEGGANRQAEVERAASAWRRRQRNERDSAQGAGGN